MGENESGGGGNVHEVTHAILREIRDEIRVLRGETGEGFRALREEMHEGFASVRQDMADGFGAVTTMIGAVRDATTLRIDDR